MTNNFPRVTAILSRIPDAATRWPGWMWPVCGVCGEDCDLDANCEHFCMKHDAESLVPKFGPILDEAHPDAWHGNDTDPRNMHHLWAMLEAIVEMPTISNGGCSRFVNEGRTTYTGATVIEAMLWCLEEATR